VALEMIAAVAVALDVTMGLEMVVAMTVAAFVYYFDNKTIFQETTSDIAVVILHMLNRHPLYF